MDPEVKSACYPDYSGYSGYPGNPDHSGPGKARATFAYSIDATHLASAYRAQIFWACTRSWFIFPFIGIFIFSLVLAFVMTPVVMVDGGTSFAGRLGGLFSPLPAMIDGVIVVALGLAIYPGRWALTWLNQPTDMPSRYARRIYRQRKDLQNGMRIIPTENGMRTMTKTMDGYAIRENGIARGQNRRVMRLYRSDVLLQLILASAFLIYSLKLAPCGQNQRTGKHSGNAGNQAENALAHFLFNPLRSPSASLFSHFACKAQASVDYSKMR